MIWISSFPRSGNTFFRNILVEVYRLESSSFYDGIGEPENYKEFPFVKTHMRPEELDDLHGEGIKAIYLVRDGRDSLVSMAHQRKDIYEPESDFESNFIEAMIAAEGSYFGGWSKNVEDWIDRSDVFIRFEDLIQNPIDEVEKINRIYKLPEKNEENLPTFKSLKFGKPKYGRGKRVANSEEEELDIIKKSFRKGKAYGWKEELNTNLQNLFWSYHRDMMERMGYDRFGGINTLDPDLDYKVIKLLDGKIEQKNKKYRILIEANKLLMHQNDGVKRYLLELLKALYPATHNPEGRWQIDVFLKGRIYPLKEYGKNLFDTDKNENKFNKFARLSKGLKGAIKLFIPKKSHDIFSKFYKKVLLKIGLKFAKTIARVSYLKHQIFKSDKSEETYEAPVDSIESGNYDLIHVPLPQHYEPFEKNSNKYLVTIHDLTHRLFSDFHTSRNVKLAEEGMNFFQDSNADFLCISESTEKDVLSNYKIDSSKLHLVLEAADNKKFRPNLNQNLGQYVRGIYGIPNKPFLLTLSTLEPRKNLINTIKAFEVLMNENPSMDLLLVISGKNGWKNKELSKFKHRDRIIFTGFVNEHDLPILYGEALALCYVSFYEGFGLPPLEAMSCKTPVIYGDNSSMKELLDGYGLAADPSDIMDIKNQMFAVVSDEKLREELETKSLERSFDFSWRKTAIDTLKVYESVIEKKSELD